MDNLPKDTDEIQVIDIIKETLRAVSKDMKNFSIAIDKLVRAIEIVEAEDKSKGKAIQSNIEGIKAIEDTTAASDEKYAEGGFLQKLLSRPFSTRPNSTGKDNE